MPSALQNSSRNPMAADHAIEAVYLHVPFCRHKCHYCDFYSIVDGDGRPDSARQGPFIEALVGEIETLLDADESSGTAPLRPRTLFVGGGTPTLLANTHWHTLLETLERVGLLRGLDEFSVEANPETVEAALVEILQGGGVNRMSIGGQSFHPDVLRTLERHHDPASVERAVRLVRKCGLDNINIDLIFGTPGQTLQMFQDDVERTLDLQPEHLACYNLTYEPDTALTQRLRSGAIERAPEALERAMYEWILDRMDAAGFEHYEISNWARRHRPTAGDATDRRCAHNLVYWHNGNWIGVGPSAASHVNGRRWKNVPHLSRYLATSPHPQRVDEEYLADAGRVGEALMLGLRMRAGIATSWLRDQLDADDPRWTTIDELEAQGLLQQEAGRLCLTRRGLWVSDAILAAML